MKRETKVATEEPTEAPLQPTATSEEPTEELTATSEAPMEHGGWCQRLVWSDGLEQSGAELSEDSDGGLGWEEVTAAIEK